MIDNRGEGSETIRLLTTIADPELAPAVELAAVYQQRWEFELTLDEVETHQMSATKLLRSRTPELVRQEIWALLLTHYAVRSLMREAADDLGEDVDRISFIRSIRVIRRQVLNQAGFSPSPPEAGNPGTLDEIKQKLLGPRRHRSYPRVVKRTQVGDKLLKRAHHRETRYSGPPQVTVFGSAA